MKYKEQLFDGIFNDFIEKSKTTYLNGKVSIREISHFAKTFAIHFYNQKTNHLDFQSIENNYYLGCTDTLIEVINRIDKFKKNKEYELSRYKKEKKATKKQIEILENGICEIGEFKLILQSLYKTKIRK